jgi:hypothetical protein
MYRFMETTFFPIEIFSSDRKSLLTIDLFSGFMLLKLYLKFRFKQMCIRC